jgi:hypothetical protein
MIGRFIFTAAALALAAIPTVSIAQEQGNYSVRNDTRMTLSCGLRRARGSAMERFALAPGAQWQSDEAGGRPRILICDAGEIIPRFRLLPGVRYAVVNAPRAGIAVLVVNP